MGKSEYFRDRHLIAVTDAARRAGVKGAALAVLSYLCTASAFKSPTVRRCKETICFDTGYGITAVKAALARLRAAGFIEPVACFEGGRNRATIYKLKANPQKGDENNTSNDEGEEKGYGKRQKGVWKTAQRGMDSIPPSISSSISSSRREKGRGLDAPDAGPHGPLGEAERAELQLFSREVTAHGYGEAKRRADARAAAADLP